MLSLKPQSRGMSIIELMIGIAISLFILAGATLVVTGQLNENRRLLIDTQIQQDMRAAADIIAHDVLRAGSTGHAWEAAWPSTVQVGLVNAYATMTPEDARGTDVGSTTTSLVYSYTNVTGATAENNVLGNDEVSGFRYNSTAKTIEIQLGLDNWQALTDPNTLLITQFDIKIFGQKLDVPCAEVCPVGPNGRPLKLSTRRVTFLMVGQSAADANVKRSLSNTVRVRNDVVREEPA